MGDPSAMGAGHAAGARSGPPDEPDPAEVIMDARGNFWRRYADGSLSMCPTSTDNLPLAGPVVVYRPDLGVWADQSAQHGVLLDEIRELHQENERLRAASPDERLREAAVIEAVAWSLFPDHPRPMSEAGLDCARRAIDTALFAAADREAPDEETP